MSIRKSLLLLLACAPFVVIGLLLSHVSSIPVRILPYSHGDPVYSNRAYANTLQVDDLKGAQIVPIDRHLKKDIAIDATNAFIVYRLITPDNDNEVFDGWEELDVAIKVIGGSCTMRSIVTKGLPKGRHYLPPGGPIAASPILLRSDGVISARLVEPLIDRKMLRWRKRQIAFLLLAISIYEYVLLRLYRKRRTPS